MDHCRVLVGRWGDGGDIPRLRGLIWETRIAELYTVAHNHLLKQNVASISQYCWVNLARFIKNRKGENKVSKENKYKYSVQSTLASPALTYPARLPTGTSVRVRKIVQYTV